MKKSKPAVTNLLQQFRVTLVTEQELCRLLVALIFDKQK